MASSKYYAQKEARALDLERDGCLLSEWGQRRGSALFATHPGGFRVFVPADQLQASDEYSEADPYSLAGSLELPFHRRRITLTLELLAEALSGAGPKPRVLDLGCGQGHLTERMRQAHPQAEISALDYSLAAIEYAHSHFPGIDFVVGNAYEPPYASGYFDAVVCNNLWEHVSDPVVLATALGRILKPNGYVVISTPSRYRLENVLRALKGKPVTLISRYHVTEYTVGQVIEQLRFAGYETKRAISQSIGAGSRKTRLLLATLTKAARLLGSHHQFESTVFFLAQKIKTA